MKKRFLLLTILLLSIIMTLSVNVTTVEAKAKTKLSTPSVELTVCKKKTIKLKNYTKLSKKKIKKVKWSTSNKRVVSIKASGKYKQNCKITAKKAGKATIKVKYNGKTYKCKVVVNHGRKAVYATRMVDDTSKPIYEEVDNGHYEPIYELHEWSGTLDVTVWCQTTGWVPGDAKTNQDALDSWLAGGGHPRFHIYTKEVKVGEEWVPNIEKVLVGYEQKEEKYVDHYECPCCGKRVD